MNSLLEAVPILETYQQRQMIERLTVRLADDLLLHRLQQLSQRNTFLFHIIIKFGAKLRKYFVPLHTNYKNIIKE